MVTARRGVWLCVAAALILLVSCMSHGGRIAAGGAEPREESTSPGSENEDSLDAADQALSELDAAGDLNTVVPLRTQSTARPVRTSRNRLLRPRRKSTRPRVDWQAIGGRRSQYETRANLPGGISFGMKLQEATGLGFLNFRGPGMIQSVHVGNLAMHMGGRLVLGRRGRFPPTAWSPVSGGVRVAPSLSRWFGQNGVAVAVRSGRWRSQGVALAREEGPLSPGALWLALDYSDTDHSVGVAYGRRLDPNGEAAFRPAVVSLHGSFRRRPLAASGEVAHFPNGGSFAAVRVTHPRAAKWSLLVYRAPTFSSTVKPALELLPGESVRRGAQLDVRDRHPGGTVTLSLRTGSIGSARKRRRFRRAILEFSGGHRGGALSWRSAVDWVHEHSRGLSAGPFPDPYERRGQRGRLYAALHLDYGQTAHDLRAYYLPPTDGGGAGWVMITAGDAEVGRLQTTWRVTAYSLAPGQRSFIARPGVGPFEFFSTVAGIGSDVSTRLRLRLGPKILLFLYYGVPYLKSARVYFGVRLRL